MDVKKSKLIFNNLLARQEMVIEGGEGTHERAEGNTCQKQLVQNQTLKEIYKRNKECNGVF